MKLSDALRETAGRLRDGVHYEWGHAGRCNCGHLVQTLTGKTSKEIYAAFRPALGEWTEHARSYCDTTGAALESLFDVLARAGLSREGIVHLEYLSDPRVLARMPHHRRLRRGERRDVVDYMEAFASVLETGSSA